MSDALNAYYDAIIPPGESGYLHLALGLNGYFNAAGTYTFRPDKQHPDAKWKPRVFRYPDERGDAFDWILDTAAVGDVYGCPNLLTGRHRDQFTAVSPRVAHGDADSGQLDYIEVQDLGGLVVASGSPGHAQILFPLSQAVTEEQRMALCVALRARYHGDDKIADNDMLRPPDTKNWKSRARGNGGPTDVRLVEPLGVTGAKPYVLARALTIELSNICTTNGSSADKPADEQVPDAGDDPKPVDLGHYSWIKESLDVVTDASHGGRSVDISRIVRDCHDAGLSVPEVRWVVGQRPDLVAKLAELSPRDDVLINFQKIADEWPHPQIRQRVLIAKIVADWEAGQAGAGKKPHLRDRLLTIEQLGKLALTTPLIDGLLYRDTLAQLSGPPGSYKTFLSLSMACCIATKTALLGHDVPERGVVIYVTAEGTNDLHKRIMAWCEVAMVEPSELLDWLRVLPLPIQLGEKVDVTQAVDVVTELKASALILDTRARCTLGLEENSASEQGLAIAAVDRIRTAADCTVLAIHHTPRTGNSGRGSNAWDGAVWSDLHIEGKKQRATVHCHKHRQKHRRDRRRIGRWRGCAAARCHSKSPRLPAGLL